MLMIYYLERNSPNHYRKKYKVENYSHYEVKYPVWNNFLTTAKLRKLHLVV